MDGQCHSVAQGWHDLRELDKEHHDGNEQSLRFGHCSLY
jgi:hypothetical protein